MIEHFLLWRFGVPHTPLCTHLWTYERTKAKIGSANFLNLRPLQTCTEADNAKLFSCRDEHFYLKYFIMVVEI
jgi:hypothetical protein